MHLAILGFMGWLFGLYTFHLSGGLYLGDGASERGSGLYLHNVCFDLFRLVY